MSRCALWWAWEKWRCGGRGRSGAVVGVGEVVQRWVRLCKDLGETSPGANYVNSSKSVEVAVKIER